MFAVHWTCLLFLYHVVQQVNGLQPFRDAVRQIPNLNLTQAALIAANATTRCILLPELCDVQLHLYSGHAFSVPLDVADSTPEIAPVTEDTKATSMPFLDDSPVQIFKVPAHTKGHQLLIFAQIEPKPKAKNSGDAQTNGHGLWRRKRKLPRRPTLNFVLT